MAMDRSGNSSPEAEAVTLRPSDVKKLKKWLKPFRMCLVASIMILMTRKALCWDQVVCVVCPTLTGKLESAEKVFKYYCLL